MNRHQRRAEAAKQRHAVVVNVTKGLDIGPLGAFTMPAGLAFYSGLPLRQPGQSALDYGKAIHTAIEAQLTPRRVVDDLQAAIAKVETEVVGGDP